MLAETLPPRPVQLMSVCGGVSETEDRGEMWLRTDVLARLELGVLLAGQDAESVGTEVVTLENDTR